MIRIKQGAVALAAAVLAVASPLAQAQSSAPDSRIGWYGDVAVGGTHYESEPGFILCRCRKGSATSIKVGAGYRFGVSAVEAWYVDFGKANFGADFYGPATSAHFRAAVLGGAWAVRWGQHVEATWRAGAAFVNASAGGSTKHDVRPTLGFSIGWRTTETATLELSWDYLRASDASGARTDAVPITLGFRQRF
ncbi:hypothetical protein [Roseateles sp. P5_E11]